LTPISLLVVAATVLGLTSIVWVRATVLPHQVRRGSLLFLGIWGLLCLGAVAAMWHQPSYILPFGLVQGGLLIVMLWGEDQPLGERTR
jgi:hypothetical protein